MAKAKNENTGLEELTKLRQRSQLGGGQQRIKQQHSKGKLTARERMSLLFDNGKYQELDPFVLHRTTDFGLDKNKVLGDAVVTG